MVWDTSKKEISYKEATAALKNRIKRAPSRAEALKLLESIVPDVPPLEEEETEGLWQKLEALHGSLSPLSSTLLGLASCSDVGLKNFEAQEDQAQIRKIKAWD